MSIESAARLSDRKETRMAKFGKVIQQLRVKADKTLREVAKKIEVSIRT